LLEIYLSTERHLNRFPIIILGVGFQRLKLCGTPDLVGKMATTLTADDWNPHWEQIVDLYLVKGWTLDEVRRYMSGIGFNKS
jgi:hypothetical protein